MVLRNFTFRVEGLGGIKVEVRAQKRYEIRGHRSPSEEMRNWSVALEMCQCYDIIYGNRSK